MDAMCSDSGRACRRFPADLPPSSGPGSSKDAWVRFARELSEAHANCMTMMDHQSATIQELKAEIESLQEKVDRLMNRGGRPPISDATVRQIERELADGRYTQSAIAARNGVSPMSVSRIARRLAKRQRLRKS